MIHRIILIHGPPCRVQQDIYRDSYIPQTIELCLTALLNVYPGYLQRLSITFDRYHISEDDKNDASLTCENFDERFGPNCDGRQFVYMFYSARLWFESRQNSLALYDHLKKYIQH
jgi:hypothetical protein